MDYHEKSLSVPLRFLGGGGLELSVRTHRGGGIYGRAIELYISIIADSMIVCNYIALKLILYNCWQEPKTLDARVKIMGNLYISPNKRK